MKKLLYILLFVVAPALAMAKPGIDRMTSPNKKVEVRPNQSGGLTISCQGKLLLTLPTIGVQSTTAVTEPLPLPQLTSRINADYTMLAGKRLHCTNEANEYTMTLADGTLLRLRAYNDGVAFRYEFLGANANVGANASERLNSSVASYAEATTYAIPEGTRRWMMQWNDAYEGFFPLSTTANAKPERGADRSALSPEGYNRRWGYPALLEPADGLFALITEANIEKGQSASCLYNDGPLFRVVPAERMGANAIPGHSSPTRSPSGRLNSETAANALGANASERLNSGNPTLGGVGSYTPWRVIITGTLADIVQSTLVTDVSKPCNLADTTWIKPGVVSWIYWAYNHGSNDYNIIKRYVDMAVTLRLPYVLIDAEWDEMKDGKTIDDALAYAREKGIKPMIWYNSSVGWIDGAPGPKFRLNKPEDREREFAWCESLGVAGVKIDFFCGDNQLNMDYCQDLLECAARHHLLVNFHGATIPRGWQRTYPNLLTTEAVYGAEWYNNVATFTDRAACHNATLPFTRNVIGPMDYTPCTFSDSQHPHITSNAHELALTVLYESGLQHLADRPESYLAQPQAVQQFLSTLPVAWDETRLVGGYPGEYVVMARRSGSTWYVAGINGEDKEKTIRLPLSFIAKRNKTLTLFEDLAANLGANASERLSSETSAKASERLNSETSANASERLNSANRFNSDKWSVSSPSAFPQSITLQPRGGFILVIK